MAPPGPPIARPRPTIVVPHGSPTGGRDRRGTRDAGLTGFLGADVPRVNRPGAAGAVVVGAPATSPLVAALGWTEALERLGDEGYVIRAATVGGLSRDGRRVERRGGRALWHVPSVATDPDAPPLAAADIAERPRLGRRLLNHWDNLDGSIERGYAGRSFWWPRQGRREGHRLRARQRVDRDQRHRHQQRQREPAVADRALAREGGRHRRAACGRTASASTLPPTSPRRRDRRPARPTTRSTPRSRSGGARRPTRSTLHPRLRRLRRQGQQRRAARTAGLSSHPRGRRERACRRARAARRHRDVARLRLQRGGRSRSRQARLRGVRAARRDVPRQRVCPGQERSARFPAARAVPPDVRDDAEDAADGGAADHAGVPGAVHPPGVPRADVEGVPRRRHLCAAARAPRVAKAIDGSLDGKRETGIAGVANTGQGRQLERPRPRAGQLVHVRTAGVEP